MASAPVETSPAPPTDEARNDGLDGVRALAVLAVIALHWRTLACGWVGVQAFFVLSAHLITRNLLADTRLPLGQYLRRFYWRRTLRIFPLYFFYLAVLAGLFAATGHPALLARYWPNLVTYTLNFTPLSPSWGNSSLLIHFWSLCVEEHFYLLWPLVIYFVRGRALKALVVALLVATPLARLALTVALQNHPPALRGAFVYWCSLSHLDAFACGAAITVFRLPERVRDPLRVLLGLATLTLLLGAFNLYTMLRDAAALHRGLYLSWNIVSSLGYPALSFRNGLHVWGWTLLDLTSAALIVCVERRMFPVLTRRPLVYVGRVSYGVYVYHMLAIAAVGWASWRLHPGGFELRDDAYVPTFEGTALFFYRLVGGVACVALVLALASASFRWFERPILALKDRVGRKSDG